MSMSTSVDQSEKESESKSQCSQHSGLQSNDISHLSSNSSGKYFLKHGGCVSRRPALLVDWHHVVKGLIQDSRYGYGVACSPKSPKYWVSLRINNSSVVLAFGNIFSCPYFQHQTRMKPQLTILVSQHPCQISRDYLKLLTMDPRLQNLLYHSKR